MLLFISFYGNQAASEFSGTTCQKYYKGNKCRQNTVFHFSSLFAVLIDFIIITRIREQLLFNIRWLKVLQTGTLIFHFFIIRRTKCYG